MITASLDELRIDRTGPERPRHRAWLWGLLLLVVLALGLAGWTRIARVADVRLAGATRSEDLGPKVLLNASGYVTARRQATVSSKVTGKVVEVFAEEGVKVKAGQVLARLDETNVRASHRLSEARLAAARAALVETRVRLREATKDLVRVERLIETGIATEAEFDAAQAELESRQARLERLQTEIVVADRELAVWTRHLEDTVIRAPFDGVVTTKDAQPGEMISPVSAGGGYTRTGICTVVDMESLEVEVDVNESYINRVTKGQPVETALDAYPDWRIPARVIAIIPTADRQKATVTVRVGFDRLDPRILPEMAVRVAFLDPEPGPDPSRVVGIPKAALHGQGEQQYVWMVEEDRARRRDVVVLEVREGQALLGQGLEVGEEAIVEASTELREGIRVRRTE